MQNLISNDNSSSNPCYLSKTVQSHAFSFVHPNSASKCLLWDTSQKFGIPKRKSVVVELNGEFKFCVIDSDVIIYAHNHKYFTFKLLENNDTNTISLPLTYYFSMWNMSLKNVTIA